MQSLEHKSGLALCYKQLNVKKCTQRIVAWTMLLSYSYKFCILKIHQELRSGRRVEGGTSM